MAKWRKHAELRKKEKKKKTKIAGRTSEEGDVGWSPNEDAASAGKAGGAEQGDPSSHLSHLWGDQDGAGTGLFAP